jgi:hypothetical protein
MTAKPNQKPRTTSKRLDLAAEFMLAFNNHDATKALSLMSANPAWEVSTGPRFDGNFHSGRDTVRATIESAFKTLPDVSYETLRTYDADDTVVIEILILSPSKNLKVQAVEILTFDGDDKIAIKRTYRKAIVPA